QCQKAVGNWRTERAFFGAFNVGVNPLVVAGGVGKSVDHVLSNGHPAGGSQIGACQIGNFIKCDDSARGNFSHGTQQFLVFRCNTWCYTNSLWPVNERTTLRALILWVHSYENSVSASAWHRAISVSSAMPLPQ